MIDLANEIKKLNEFAKKLIDFVKNNNQKQAKIESKYDKNYQDLESKYNTIRKELLTLTRFVIKNDKDSKRSFIEIENKLNHLNKIIEQITDKEKQSNKETNETQNLVVKKLEPIVKKEQPLPFYDKNNAVLIDYNNANLNEKERAKFKNNYNPQNVTIDNYNELSWAIQFEDTKEKYKAEFILGEGSGLFVIIDYNKKIYLAPVFDFDINNTDAKRVFKIAFDIYDEVNTDKKFDMLYKFAECYRTGNKWILKTKGQIVKQAKD